MENFYLALTTSGIFKKLAKHILLIMLVLVVSNLAVNGQTPAISYPGPKIFGTGAAISAFGPGGSSDVSALNFSQSAVVNNTPNFPSAMAVDAAGNIYFATTDQVYKVPRGANSGSLIAEGFYYVSCIAVDANGDLFVGEGNNQDVIKITNPGQAGSVRSTFITDIGIPGGIAFDEQNHLFISEYNGKNDLIRYTLVGGAATNKTVIVNDLSIPRSIAIDKAGNIFIADYGKVYKMSATLTSYPVPSSSLQVLASDVVGTDGLALDNGGNIYVTGFDGNVLHRIDAVTNNLTDLPGALISPGAVATDAAGNIYVVTSNGQTIFKYTQNGGYSISGLPAGLIFNANTGEVSGTPVTLTTPTDYTITAYNASGNKATAVVNMQVLSGNATLSGITLSTGSIAPTFNAAVTSYTATVSNAISNITITANAVETGGTISINGAAASSATASANIALAEGANTITIVVTAPGTNTKTYNLTVTRQGTLSVQYGGPQYYSIGATVSPLIPSSAAVAPFGYNQTSFSAVGGSPTGIAVGKNGNVAVAVGGAVKRIDAAGTVTATITIPSYSAQFVAMDSVGNIYTLNTGSSATFRKISAADNTVTTISGGAATPSSLMVDPTGTYLYYSVITSVRRMPIGGGSGFQLTTGYSTIAGMAMNKAGDLFISDATGVYRVPAANAITTAVPKTSLGGTYISGYASTAGLAAGNAGELFISDFGAKVVRRVDPSKTVTTISGTMAGPKWLAVNENGDVYVSDNSGTTVQRLAQNGGFYINPILPAGLSFNTTTGAISGIPTTSTAAAAYTVTARGDEGAIASSSVTITIADASLSNITVNDESLSPTFSGANPNYDLATSKASIAVTAATNAIGATITINGIAATSGTASTIALNFGNNVIPIVVKAADGITTNTYTLTVNRASAPTLAYAGGPYTFTTSTAISPVTPAKSNVAPFAYRSSTRFYSTPSSANNISIDGFGNIFTIAGSTCKIAPNGSSGTTLPNSAPFYMSVAITTDAAGNFYVGDYDEATGGYLAKIAPNGTYTKLLTGGLSYISNIGLDEEGNIYFTESNLIKKLNVTTKVVTIVTTAIQTYSELAVDKKGNIYVYGGPSNRYIYKIPAKAPRPVALEQMVKLGNGLSDVSGVTVDNMGNVYVVSQALVRSIQKITPDNVTTTVASVPSPGLGIAIDTMGNIYTSSQQSASYGVLRNKQIGGYYVKPALPAGLSIDQTTGAIIGTPTEGSPATDYTIYAYNLEDNYTTATINIKTVDATLSNLALSNGTLSSAFNASTESYTATTTLAAIKLTPTVNTAGATITVNGITVASGSASANIPLNVGNNIIPVVVTSGEGATKTYTLTIYRPAIPTIDYSLSGTQTLNVGTAVAPIAPTSSGVSLYGTNGYPTSVDSLSTVTSLISAPWNISIDATGTLYVANQTSVAKVVNNNVTPLTGDYFNPYGIAADGNGNYYVADYQRGILKNGVVFSSVSVPVSVTVDVTGNIYVGVVNGEIRKIAAGTTGPSTVFVTGGRNPYGITTDVAGNVYVASEYARTLTKYTPAGAPTVLATGLIGPTGVKVDGTGNIYITSTKNLQFIPASVTSFPTTPLNLVGTGAFTSLSDLAIDNANNIYLSDDVQGTIRKMTPVGGYYISPGLPAGLSFDNTTGTISGTPTTSTVAKTYTITAYNSEGFSAATTISLKAVSNDATLAALAINQGTLSPVFSPAVIEYSATLGTSSIIITPKSNDIGSTITVNGVATTSGSASASVPLAIGINNIPVVVTSGDGSVVKTYALNITRVPGLTNLTVSNGALTPAFSPSKFAYTMSVASSTAAITFTPEASEGPITVNGATVTSGSPSQSIALAPGVNAINIVVTAADGVTTNTYAIAITRLLPQTITFAFSGNQPTGLPDSSPASSSSGLPITYASSNTSRAPIVNGKIHLQTIGSVVITASQPGNSVYEAATPVSQTIAVTKGTAVITLATRDTVVYGAANYTPAVSTNTGTNITLSSNNTAVITTASSNTRLKINGIGTAVITASQAGTTNYNAPASKTQTIVVVKAPATAPIIFPALAAVRYNEQDFSPGATSTIPVVITYISSDTTVAKIVNGNIHVVSPGTTTITASQAAADAFHLPPTPVSQSLTVKPIPVLLSSLSLSAGQLTKLDNNTYTALITGLATDRLKLTPTATDAGSTITVNGVAVQSGEPSQFITLNAAGTPTLITIVVQDTALNSQPITLTVNRQAFTNADLASLQVSAGVLTKTGETTYQTIIRDNTVTRLSLNAITADATATLAINGVPTASGTNSALINLNSTGQTAINIQATAESGATKTYTLNVIKLSANADLASLSFNRGKLTRTSDTGYNLVVVGSVISQVYQSATTANSKATLTVNGSAVTSGSNVAVPLNATGPTTVAIVVTAENDATKTYTVNITRDLSREASANADLKGLVFNTGVATKVTATESNLVVLSGTSQILQTVITASTAATLTVNGVTAPSGSKVTIPLNATGTTVVTTVITAENGTTKTYTVNVTKQPSSNAEIKGLVFNTGVATKVSPTLSNLVVSTGTSQIAQTIFTADTAATLTVNGAPATSGGKVIIQLNATGTTTITNVITAENGTAKTYIVKVNRELSANADMKGLVFNTGVATKISDTESTVLVSLATTQITQTVITADTAATLTVNGVAATSGVKVTIRLNATGKTVITNVITAENGTTKTYTVNVTKPLSSNAEMKGLVFNTGVATKINATESNLVVTAGTSQITQTIITADAAATLTVNGVTATSGAKVTIPLNATGTTTITNVITAENGTAKTYTVTVSKELSANADLKGLIFSTGVATKVSEVESNLVVSAGTAQILQTVITADTAATLTVNGVTATSGAKVTIPLNATGTTTITNVITAENGNAKTYTVNVTKQQSANADLKGLVFSTGVATKVNATVTNLVVTGLTISQITQTLTPADAAATLTVNGATATSGAKVTIPLNATGTTTITNVITAESGATKTYTVNVTKQASTNTALRGLVYDTGVTTRVGPTESNLVVSGLTIGQVTQTTITADAAATLTVNGASATSGSGVVIPLNTTGTTTVTTIVTAESGATKTYKVNITKQPSANADLSSLILDADTLSKTTATDYSVVVGNLATTVVQKVTTADAGATLTVNGATVVSGSDVVITLNDDTPTIITTIVTSETGVTKTYTVTVSKPSMTTTSLTSGNKATTNSTARETTSSLIPHQALSPNGDGINDYFEIEGIAAYPNNAVTIINRNGSKVYEVKGYDNQSKRFDGHSNINGALLPVGTYFYLIEYTKDGQKVRKTGYMAIKN